MKKYVWLTLGLAAVMALLWWGNEWIKQPPLEFLPMVCVESYYYEETEEVTTELPEDWTEVGEIAKLHPMTEDMHRRHLESNCCGVGCKVYVPPRESKEEIYSELYVLQPNGTYLYHKFLAEE